MTIDELVYQDYYLTFATESGQRVLQDLRAQFHDRQAYVVGATNPVDLAFFEGQRSVVLSLLAFVQQGQPHSEPSVENNSKEHADGIHFGEPDGIESDPE